MAIQRLLSQNLHFCLPQYLSPYKTHLLCLVNRSFMALSLIKSGGKSLQSCPTLCDSMECSPPGSSVLEILQARILEWVDMSSSREIFPTQGSKLGLLHWQADSLPLAKQGSKKQFHIRVESPSIPLHCASLHHPWRANHSHSLQLYVYHPHHSVTLTSLLSPDP